MIALLLFGLIASACAAPQVDLGQHSPFSQNVHSPLRPYSDVNNVNTDQTLNKTPTCWTDGPNLLHSFFSPVSQEGIEGNMYKFIIPMPIFEKKDILVQAGEGAVAIQANHQCDVGHSLHYLTMRNLPNTVNVAGHWILEQGYLKITFPLKEGAVTPETVQTSTEPLGTTQQQIFKGNWEAVKIFVDKIDPDDHLALAEKEYELRTYKIPDRNTVEATTYSMNLKDEKEIVPVKY